MRLDGEEEEGEEEQVVHRGTSSISCSRDPAHETVRPLIKTDQANTSAVRTRETKALIAVYQTKQQELGCFSPPLGPFKTSDHASGPAART